MIKSVLSLRTHSVLYNVTFLAYSLNAPQQQELLLVLTGPTQVVTYIINYLQIPNVCLSLLKSTCD